jgi:hypothetical protein
VCVTPARFNPHLGDSQYGSAMTYCVAWQYRGSVFLVADSAVTSGREPASRHSSFGELHPFENGVAVEESALKVFRWPKLALTGCGDADAIREMVWEIDACLERGCPPWIALITARKRLKLKPGLTLEAVAATRLFGVVQLLRLTEEGEWKWVHPEMSVHLGSPAPELKGFVNGAIVDARRACATARTQLAAVLATCQSLTVHNHLMAQGAGGAFSGLIVNRHGTQWQPDMAYLIVDPDGMAAPATDLRVTRDGLHVSCIVRDDILFVSSPAKKGAVVFVASNKRDMPEGLRPRLTEAFADARRARDNCRYDFVGLISTRWPLTAVMDMAGRSETPYLKLELAKIGGERTLIIHLERRVAEALRNEPKSLENRVFFFSDEQHRTRAA